MPIELNRQVSRASSGSYVHDLEIADDDNHLNPQARGKSKKITMNDDNFSFIQGGLAKTLNHIRNQSLSNNNGLPKKRTQNARRAAQGNPLQQALQEDHVGNQLEAGEKRKRAGFVASRHAAGGGDTLTKGEYLGHWPHKNRKSSPPDTPSSLNTLSVPSPSTPKHNDDDESLDFRGMMDAEAPKMNQGIQLGRFKIPVPKFQVPSLRHATETRSASNSTLGISKRNNNVYGTRVRQTMASSAWGQSELSKDHGCSIVPGAAIKATSRAIEQQQANFRDQRRRQEQMLTSSGGLVTHSRTATKPPPKKKSSTRAAIQSWKNDSDEQGVFGEDNTPRRTSACRRFGRGSKEGKSAEHAITLDDEESDDGNVVTTEVMAAQHVNNATYLFPARFAIGKRVFSTKCQLLVVGTSITLSFKATKRATRRSSSAGDAKKVDFDMNLIEAVHYHKCEMADDEVDQLTFCSIRTGPCDGLKEFNSYQPQGEDPKKRYLSIDFRDDCDLNVFLERLAYSSVLLQTLVESGQVDVESMEEYASVLLQHQRNASQQGYSISSPRPKLFAGMEDHDIVLSFPNGVDQAKMEECAARMTQLVAQEMGTYVTYGEDTATENGSKLLGQQIDISVGDFERLEPEIFLNDNLIDFIMRWMSRFDTKDVHFFSTHFFPKLQRDGVEKVRRWTEKKGLNIFKKKLTFVTINKDLHWSLAVIANPGAMEEMVELEGFDPKKDLPWEEVGGDRPVPFILFFDSLKSHNKNMVANALRKWLNAEWHRVHGEHAKPFTPKTMPVISPTAPYQDNYKDCGLYVCRYAYGVFNLRHLQLTKDECLLHDKTQALRRIITDDPLFDFDPDSIVTLRAELRQLILDQSGHFLPWKKKHDELMAISKRKERAKKRLAVEHVGVAPAADEDSKPAALPGTTQQSTQSTDVELIENGIKQSSDKENGEVVDHGTRSAQI